MPKKDPKESNDNGCCKKHSGVVEMLNTIFHRQKETNDWIKDVEDDVKKKISTTVALWLIGGLGLAMLTAFGWSLYAQAYMSDKLDGLSERMSAMSEEMKDDMTDIKMQLSKNTATLEYYVTEKKNTGR